MTGPTLQSPPKATDETSDEALITEHLSGDPLAFPKLVVRYQQELFHFLVRFTGDRTLADDVFQETFLQVHQSIAQFDVSRRFRPWLFTVAANKARDMIRAQSRRQSSALSAPIGMGSDSSTEYLDLMEADIPQPGSPLEAEEISQKVRKTVHDMPEHLREVLLLAYFNQFPYQQISEMLDIPLGTVKSRLHSAVAYFGEKWKSTNSNPLES